jgi:hypothetical protein
MPAAPASSPPLLVPLTTTTTATAVDAAQVRSAYALVALLDQALNLAAVELARLKRDASATPSYTLPDAAVEQAARLLVVSPAVKGAAGFLAMSAQEVAE